MQPASSTAVAESNTNQRTIVMNLQECHKPTFAHVAGLYRTCPAASTSNRLPPDGKQRTWNED
jgi:hypothetical protein